jgi:uncharacterized protein (DUF433 family)
MSASASIENKIMNDEKWIVSDRDHLGGKPCLQETRISVAFLLECLANGMSVAEIVDAYPTLTENAVQGALRELAHERKRRRCEDSPGRIHASQVLATLVAEGHEVESLQMQSITERSINLLRRITIFALGVMQSFQDELAIHNQLSV